MLEVATKSVKPTLRRDAVKTMLARVPAPRLSPMRQALSFTGDQYKFLEEHWRRLGDTFSFRIPGEVPRLIVAAPDDIKKIFALRPEQYYSADRGVHVNFGESCVLFADGERHRRDRQLLTPPLHGEMLRSYGHIMLGAIDEETVRWSVGDEIAMQDAFSAATLRVIARSILGATEPERELQLCKMVRQWLDVTLSPAMFAIGAMVGLNRMRRFLERQTDRQLHGSSPRISQFAIGKSIRLKAALTAMLTEDVRRCRREGTNGRTDVLAVLSQARYEDGAQMDERAVVDQLTLLFSAGHDTTAKALCWAILDVIRHPGILDRLRRELDEHFGPMPLDPARVADLPFLNAVIKESMRLTPVTTVLQREITEPIEIGGYVIPAGVVLAPSNYLAQRHPSVWKDPDVFMPERFLHGKTYAPYEYFPFGGGRRRCLGVAFASFEMPILLASVIRRFDLRLVARSNPAPRYRGVTIGPADGLRVVVEKVRP
ncbi:MAG: cytochrome P450 [Polyangiaceae bacterium]